MGKYLYLDTNEMKHLMKKAIDLEMVFKRPNDVLRDVLGLGAKSQHREHRGRKVRLRSPRQTVRK